MYTRLRMMVMEGEKVERDVMRVKGVNVNNGF